MGTGGPELSASPPATKGDNEMREKVEAALDRIRPALRADGGDVELVGVQDGVVTVRLMGACHGCPMATLTLKQGVERTLRSLVPEIKTVEAL